MGRNSEIEREFIRQIASNVHDLDFITGALYEMNNDDDRQAIIDFIKTNAPVGKKQIEDEMISIEFPAN